MQKEFKLFKIDRWFITGILNRVPKQQKVFANVSYNIYCKVSSDNSTAVTYSKPADHWCYSSCIQPDSPMSIIPAVSININIMKLPHHKSISCGCMNADGTILWLKGSKKLSLWVGSWVILIDCGLMIRETLTDSALNVNEPTHREYYKNL